VGHLHWKCAAFFTAHANSGLARPRCLLGPLNEAISLAQQAYANANEKVHGHPLHHSRNCFPFVVSRGNLDVRDAHQESLWRDRTALFATRLKTTKNTESPRR